MIERIQQIVSESLAAKRAFFAAHSSKVARAAELLVAAIRADGKVLIFGNGGSAADAQHIAAELVNRLNYDRPPIAAIVLTTDTSILTSVFPIGSRGRHRHRDFNQRQFTKRAARS